MNNIGAWVILVLVSLFLMAVSQIKTIGKDIRKVISTIGLVGLAIAMVIAVSAVMATH
jgi:uncharacterized membrane protein